jgi:hypothetical protein
MLWIKELGKRSWAFSIFMKGVLEFIEKDLFGLAQCTAADLGE